MVRPTSRWEDVDAKHRRIHRHIATALLAHFREALGDIYKNYAKRLGLMTRQVVAGALKEWKIVLMVERQTSTLSLSHRLNGGAAW